MRYTFGCCARATSGHVTAAPLSSVMTWRRPRSGMGSPPEPARPAYRTLRIARKRSQVLGADLNRSESRLSPTTGGGYSDLKVRLLVGFELYLTRHACLIGARRGPIAVGIEVIATADMSKGPLRSALCELHCALLAGCSSGRARI
jgi:hypothetical protein